MMTPNQAALRSLDAVAASAPTGRTPLVQALNEVAPTLKHSIDQASNFYQFYFFGDLPLGSYCPQFKCRGQTQKSLVTSF